MVRGGAIARLVRPGRGPGRNAVMKIAISVTGKEKTKGLDSPYVQALLMAGGRPEEIQMVTAADAGKVSSRDFDGILFAGGEDVDPGFYEERIKYDSVRADRSR